MTAHAGLLTLPEPVFDAIVGFRVLCVPPTTTASVRDVCPCSAPHDVANCRLSTAKGSGQRINTGAGANREANSSDFVGRQHGDAATFTSRAAAFNDAVGGVVLIAAEK